MSSLMENSDAWGLLKITIPTPAAAISPDNQPCRSCMVFHYSGSATFMAPSSAAATDIPLPNTLATAFPMPIRNLKLLSFFGTAGDVVMIIWRK